jgi:adenylate cyclase 10
MKPCVFGIDDAHWIDPDSWLFLLDLVREPNALLIFNMRPLESIVKKPPALIEILEHPNTKVLKLEGLSPEHTVQLTCQLLDVVTIPQQLQEIIHKKSHGVPLWCEELVETMLELEYLRIEDDDVNKDMGVEERRRGRSVFLHKGRERSGSLAAGMASVVGEADIPIPDSVTGMVLARIDHMSASDQMTLKCASILGTRFTRTMLQAIIPDCNTMAFNKSLDCLAEAGIIECNVGAKWKALVNDEEMSEESKENAASRLYCPCLKEHKRLPTATTVKYHHASLPPVMECEDLGFVHNYIQETAYNLCTESQRKTLHESAAHFLENQAHKCKNCGGGDFLAGRHSEVKRKKNISRKAYRGVSRLQARTERRTSSISSGAACPDGGGERKESGCSSEDSKGGASRLSLISLRPTSGKVMLDVDMEECHCDEVLAKVYPQLVRHWRAAGDPHNTMIYLIEEASAALATFNNMEALSLLQEAQEITGEMEGGVTSQERGRMESLVGQVREMDLAYLGDEEVQG